MKIELVVFDMAGTTIQDSANVASAFVNALAQQQRVIRHSTSRRDTTPVSGGTLVS
jgi:hypothetical protein